MMFKRIVGCFCAAAFLIQAPVWAGPKEDLIQGVRTVNEAQIRKAIEQGAPLETVIAVDEETSRLVLGWAAEEGKLELVKYLLSKGAKIDGADPDGNTPLLRAVSNVQYDTTKFLLDKGADIQWRNEESMNVISIYVIATAFAEENPALFRLLVEKGFDAKTKLGSGITLLMLAAMFDETESLAWLLKKGAEINARESDGRSALHYAAGMDNTAGIQLLLAKGAALESKNQLGETPLHLAIHKGSLDSSLTLLKLGANPNASDAKGETVLEAAVRNGQLKLVQALVEAGADRSKYAKALELARKEHQLEIVQYLEGLK